MQTVGGVLTLKGTTRCLEGIALGAPTVEMHADMQGTFGWQVHLREKMSYEARATKTHTHMGDT